VLVAYTVFNRQLVRIALASVRKPGAPTLEPPTSTFFNARFGSLQVRM